MTKVDAKGKEKEKKNLELFQRQAYWMDLGGSRMVCA